MIDNQLIQNSNTNIYTVPTGESHTIVLITLCNTDTSNPETITLYAVKNGDTPGTHNMILNNAEIPAGDTYMFDVQKFILEEGDSIVGIGNTGNIVAATVSHIMM